MHESAAPVTWRRSARARRMTLRVDPVTSAVVLTLPMRAHPRDAQAFVDAHAAWIARTVAALPTSAPLASGGMVPIEGVDVPIIHEPGARRGTWRDAAGLHVSGEAAHTPRRVIAYLTDLARETLAGHVRARAHEMQLTPTRLDLRDVRSRWGSCTRNGRIMLSWRLVMAPVSVRDYVIVHELSHLRHFDHSAEFWALVESFYPSGRPGRLAAERWLRENGTALLRIA